MHWPRKLFSFASRTAITCFSAALITVTFFLSGYLWGWKTEPAGWGRAKSTNVATVAPADPTPVPPADSQQSAPETPLPDEVRIELASLARQLIGGRDHRTSQTRVIAKGLSGNNHFIYGASLGLMV